MSADTSPSTITRRDIHAEVAALASSGHLSVARVPGAPNGESLWSDYAETWWLPTVGPSALWAARRLWRWAGSPTHPVDVKVPVLAEALGLGAGHGPNSAVVRTVTRVVSFGLARLVDDQLHVPDTVPVLPERFVRRLSPELRAALDEAPRP